MNSPSTKKNLKIYNTPDGKEPFIQWINSIKDLKTRYRIRARIDRLEVGNFGDCKFVGQGVYELRTFFGPGYRVYFGKLGEEIVLLLCGGDKSTQKKDIKKAQAYFKEYERRS